MLRIPLHLTVKGMAASFLRSSGIDAVLWKTALRNHLLVVCYHSVVPERDGQEFLDDSVLTQSEFKQQLEEMLRWLEPITAGKLVQLLEERRGPARPSVLITFDDGFRNNLLYAVPVLSKLGVPAMFSITTGYIGSNRVLWPNEIALRVLLWPDDKVPVPARGGGLEFHAMPSDTSARKVVAENIREVCKWLPPQELDDYLKQLRAVQSAADEGIDEDLHAFMNWDEVRELARLGFTIASHTVNHPILSGLRMEDLRKELWQSKEMLESELHQPCLYLVYPNGCTRSVSPQVLEEAALAGYRAAFTLTNSMARMDGPAHAIARVYLPGGGQAAITRFRTSALFGLIQSRTVQTMKRRY